MFSSLPGDNEGIHAGVRQERRAHLSQVTADPQGESEEMTSLTACVTSCQMV